MGRDAAVVQSARFCRRTNAPGKFMTSHYSRCLETTHDVSVSANKHTLIRAYEDRPPMHRKSRTPDPGMIGEAYLGEGCEDDCLTIDPTANGRQG
jgi:hypothetical protein